MNTVFRDFSGSSTRSLFLIMFIYISTCSQYTLSLVLFFFFVCVFLNEEIKEEKRRERGEIRSVWEVQVQSVTFTVTIHSGSAPSSQCFGTAGPVALVQRA